jgi:hypothetical protein
MEKIKNMFNQWNRYTIPYINSNSGIINTLLEGENEYIIHAKFDLVIGRNSSFGRRIILKRGINNFLKNKGSLKGENFLITIRFLNINLVMKIEYGSIMEEVYQRVAEWLNLYLKNINLIEPLCPGGKKIRNLAQDIVVRDDKPLVIYLKVEISKISQNNLNKRVYSNIMNDLKKIEIEGKIYFLNKYLNIRIIKKLIIFKWEVINHWPEFHDTDNGTNYLDNALLKDVAGRILIM